MDKGIQPTKGFCKSLCGAVGHFALTIYGMAEMTGFNSSASSASQQATTVAQPVDGGASVQQVAATGGVVNTVTETVPALPNNTDYLVELSASASNQQISTAAQSTLPKIDPPSSLDAFALSREGDAFKLRGNGVSGVGYILEGSSDLKNWFVIARNIPTANAVEFEVRPDSRAEFAFLRVRAERVLTATSVNVADLIIANLTPSPVVPGTPSVPPVITNPEESVTTGITGG